MRYAIFQQQTGEILRVVSCPEEQIELQLSAGTSFVALEFGDDETHYIEDGEPTAFPPRPSPAHTFDFTVKAWVDPRSLDTLKAAKREQINTWRLEANQTRFVFEGYAIQADPLSRGDIDGVNGIVTLTGTLPEGFPNAWKTESNEWVPIPDVATWAAFYGAMVGQGQANFAIAQDLKADVAAATTPEAVAAVAWPISTSP